MGRYWSFLIAIILPLVCCLVLAGCLSSTGKKGAEAVPPATEPVEAEVVSAAQENLSMAKQLREVPTTPYILGPEDEVQITVYRHKELNMHCTVSPEGKISYYLVGDLQAAGLTRFQLRDKIQKGLAKYIKEPQVVVSISQARSHKIFVLGEVKNPGVYRMRNNFTLVEAISAAGGVGDAAYLSGAYVVRNDKILLVNFYELIRKGNAEENIPLLAGDVIYIPDDEEQRVFVLGEVHKQTAVAMRERMTLFEAVAEAGGFTRDAEMDSIVLMRGNLSEPEVMKINAEDMNLQANIALERGDIIYVSSTTLANIERIAVRVSHILQPFLDVARGIILQDATIDVLDGGTEDARVVVP